jgi:acyl-CoA thioesterase FadM
MARIKIELPESWAFTTNINLRITDMNYGGHLANDAVLGIAHEARLRFLNSMNYSEMDIEGKSLIMTDAAIVYKAQGYHGDELIVHLAPVEFTKIGFELVYVMTNQKTEKEVARVKTGLAFFDYSTNKISPVPERFRNRF